MQRFAVSAKDGQTLAQTWTDNQVVATVAATALSGVAKIQQNGAWSNALGFTVPAPGKGKGA